VEIGQANALAVQPVDVRRLDDRVAMAGEVGVALIVGKYKYDIWYTWFICTFCFIYADY
jgi:hypothetical protein